MSDEPEPAPVECECGTARLKWDADLDRWYCPECDGEEGDG